MFFIKSILKLNIKGKNLIMDTFKDFLKKIKWDSIIVALLTVALGILCICLPTQVGDVLCIIFGCSLLAIGFSLFIRFFTVNGFFGGHVLLSAILTIVLGTFCLFYPNSILSILTMLLGLFIVIDSAYSLNDSIICAQAKVKGWLLLFIISLITMALGVVVMFAHFSTVMVFAGVSLLIEGVKRFILTFVYSKKLKQAQDYLHAQSKKGEIIIED